MEKDWFKSIKEFDFVSETISHTVLERLKRIANDCQGDILKMTTIAGSGHPGGSLSSIHIYTLVYCLSNLTKNRIVISHGHTSPGVYSILGRLGIIDRDEVLSFFRYAGSPFEGHVESHIPHIMSSTGNLGQGLSAGCGFALGLERIISKLREKNIKPPDTEKFDIFLAHLGEEARKEINDALNYQPMITEIKDVYGKIDNPKNHLYKLTT